MDLLLPVLLTLALTAPAGPGPATASPITRSGEQVVGFQCALCHGPGVSGAPRIGDRKAWEKRLAGGEERLLRSATEGRGAMPPNGGLADLSPQELRAAIDYMLRSSGAR